MLPIHLLILTIITNNV